MNGVQFKAYHFIRDAQNNVVKVEELEVTVTPLGLIVMVYSFSPFAIVALPGTAEASTDKTVIVTNTSGGTAYANIDGVNSNLFKVKEGESRTLTIKANSGYVIESVKLNDSAINVTNTDVMTIELKNEELAAQSIFDVKFVPEKVKQAEEARGETSASNPLKRAVIKVNESAVTVKAGETLRLNTTVMVYCEDNVYQWFKDGVELAGQTDAYLEIAKVKAEDAGKYTLKVTSTSGTSTAVSESTAIEVTVEKGSSITGIIVTIVVVVVVVLSIVLLTVVIIKRRRAAEYDD